VLREIKVALRSLSVAKGLSLTIILTLALGIGANAAIFSVVRGVLLRPLTNRDEGHLIYIRQSAKGIGAENTTFSVPEIQDLRERSKSFKEIGEFSTISFTMIGLGDPRVVQAGIVDGNYFDVMGLHPVLGRLLNPSDDGPKAAGAVVLTYRFWTTSLKSDASILGKSIRLGTQEATIVGVLEPSDPYPAQTELIANVVTSPHHLSATMVTGREHRMTEIFGRLAPGVSLESARTELHGIHQAVRQEHPEAYSPKADFQISAVPLRDQITSNARTVLLVLLAASGLVFVIACSNVANLILARSVRREGELAVRAALGANVATLRKTLLAESLLLCGTGAALGIAVAPLMFSVLARYASRFSVRALDLTLDSSALWIGVALALAAAVLLAFVPRLPSSEALHGFGLTGSGLRVTGGTKRKLRLFAIVQIAASFVLLAGAGMLVKTLLSLQAARPGFDTSSVVAIDVPVVSFGRTPDQIRSFYRQLRDETATLPGVESAVLGSAVPWRDTGGAGAAFSVEGKQNANSQDDPRAYRRNVSPGFFAALGIPLLAGRDFNDADRKGADRVVIISERVAKELFPGQDPINRHMQWTDSIMRFIGVSTEPRRIVGVVADVDDTHTSPEPMMTVYAPFDQDGGSRLFLRVHSGGDAYSVVPAVTRIAHELAPDQPIEHAATLEDVRSEVLAPERLNSIVFGGFAAVALAISVVGIAGVLAFSVSARMREFGVRLAVGSQPRHLLSGVLLEGMLMAVGGVVAGAVGGFALARLIGAYFLAVELPGIVPIFAAAAVLISAATIASLLPAVRVSRVDVIQALRSE
jgi:putative ABC transport system permease protein